MWRELEPRTPDRERVEPSRGSGTGGTADGPSVSIDSRNVLIRDLDLPRGSTRERVRVGRRTYELHGAEVRTLATVGAFRVVPEPALRHGRDSVPGRRSRELTRLRKMGLVETMPYIVGPQRTRLVTLTRDGLALLEHARRERSEESRQLFYAGIAKPRELAHDVRLHGAYLKAAERLQARGARIRRVVLEEELKREYQRFLQGSGLGRAEGRWRPVRSADDIEQWARDREIPVLDGHVQFPDVRLEYEERDGRRAVEDIEVVTPHYRGAHAAAMARRGFARYRAVGARLGGARSGGGGRTPDPRLAEEMLS
jgi:DNA-binding MarR family transcriptional regulator